jgi:hypothetical protein
MITNGSPGLWRYSLSRNLGDPQVIFATAAARRLFLWADWRFHTGAAKKDGR